MPLIYPSQPSESAFPGATRAPSESVSTGPSESVCHPSQSRKASTDGFLLLFLSLVLLLAALGWYYQSRRSQAGEHWWIFVAVVIVSIIIIIITISIITIIVVIQSDLTSSVPLLGIASARPPPVSIAR